MARKYLQLLTAIIVYQCVNVVLIITGTSGYTCHSGNGEVLIRSSSLDDSMKHSHSETIFNSIENNNNSSEKMKQLRKRGVFTSPQWPKLYERGTRCIYRFIANIGEKVHIKFDQFFLSGDMPIVKYSLSVDLSAHSFYASVAFEVQYDIVWLMLASSGIQEECHFHTPVSVLSDENSLVGLESRCSVDFLDVYIDVASSTLDMDRQSAIFTQASSSALTGEQQTTTPFSAAVYSSVLDKSDLLGRYCGNFLSSNSVTFTSLHRELVIDFYADLERPGNSWYTSGKLHSYGFNGTFEFINDDAFYPGKALSSAELHIPFEDDLPSSPTTTSSTVGVPTLIRSSNCRFRIEAEHMPKTGTEGGTNFLDDVSGELISPTYPGFHPNNLICAYQLIGLPYQRINLEILDINLYSGSPGCPKDFIQFYDGFQIDNTSISTNSIGQRICDISEDSIHIVSSGPSLVVLFVTGQIQMSHTSGSSNNDEQNVMMKVFNSNRRGFRLRYTFTKKLLPVSEIPGGSHIRGTECDYLINRHDSVERQLESPTLNNNLVLMPNRVCNFIFIGDQFRQYFETVSIGFEQIELPKPSEGSQKCDRGHMAIYGSRSSIGDQIIQKPKYEYSHEILHSNKEPDHIFCDRLNELESITVRSGYHHYPINGRHNVLVIRFNSSGSDLPGLSMKFTLNYRFKKDFGIPGTMINPGGCQFLYINSFDATVSTTEASSSYSSTASSKLFTSQMNKIPPKGWTNSPLYPNDYSPNSDCLYIFTPQTDYLVDQSIRLVFETFTTAHRLQMKDVFVNITEVERFQNCHEDFLEIIQLYIPLKEEVMSALTSRVNYPSTLERSYEAWIQRWHNLEKELQIYLGTNQHILEPTSVYCGSYVPGPVVSDTSATAILMRFHSGQNTTSKGFTLTYEFLPKALLNPVKSNVADKPASDNNNKAKQMNKYVAGGLITSPNYPNSYTNGYNHEWYIKGTLDNSRIQLQFNFLELEGSLMNCSRAVLRIYEGHNPRSLYEFCGNPSELSSIIISNPVARVKMHTATDASGSKGFELVWTDLLPNDPEIGCKGFLCEHTSHCIYNDLECDEIPNCGMYQKNGKWVKDESDETTNCSFGNSYNLAHIGTGILLALIFLLSIACYVYYHEYKRRKNMPLDPLTELTGSKHSLALNQSTQKLNAHCSNKKHQLHKHHNCQTSGLLCDLLTEKETDVSSVKKHQHHRHHYPHAQHLSHSHQIPSHTHPHRHHHHHNHNRKVFEQGGHSHLVNAQHDYHGAHFPLDNQHDHCRTNRMSNKLQQRTPSHSGSLVRNGGRTVVPDSLHSSAANNPGGLLVAGTGTNLSTSMDGGLLIRERMQKISIV